YRSSIIRPACPVSISLYLHDALPIYGLEHSIDIAKKYRDAGVDMFHISSGGEAPAGKVKPANHPGYQIPFARAYKEALNVPVIAVGILEDPALAEATIANGDAELV